MFYTVEILGILGCNIQQSNPMDMLEEEKATNARERTLADSIPIQQTQKEEPKHPKGLPTLLLDLIEVIFSKFCLHNFVRHDFVALEFLT